MYHAVFVEARETCRKIERKEFISPQGENRLPAATLHAQI
jgi:hypothetical protein